MKRVAVLGAHEDPDRAAFYVPDYLFERGCEVLPVNPLFRGASLWGKPIEASLTALQGPVDIVDVFRAPRNLMAHLPDILAMKPLPTCVWLQSGIRHKDFSRELIARGIDVVQDRCLMVDYRRLIKA